MGLKRILILTLLWSVSILPAAAGEMSQFSILQTAQRGESLLFFCEALEESGLPVQGLKPDNLRVTLGAEPANLASFQSFGDSREGMAVLFLVDISRSLKAKEFAGIRTAMSDWIQDMKIADRVSVIAFGEEIEILSEFEQGRDRSLGAVQNLKPTDNHTQLHRAILSGLEVGRRVDLDLPARRVVVLVSDGMDDTRGGATRGEVLRELEERGIPLWAIGFHSGKLTEAKREGLSGLGEMARISGGDAFLVSGNGGFAGAFEALRVRLDGSYVGRVDSFGVLETGEPVRLQAVLARNGRAFTDGRDVRLFKALMPVAAPQVTPVESPDEPVADLQEAETSPEGGDKKAGFPYLPVAGGFITLALGLFFFRPFSRRSREDDVPGEAFTEKENPEAETVSASTGVVPAAPQSSGMSVKLEVVRGSRKGETLELTVDRAVSVGRSRKGNQLIMEGDLGISGRHLEFYLEQDRLFVRDLGSTNGTFVNGVRIQAAQRIQKDDLILVGGTELRVLIDA